MACPSESSQESPSREGSGNAKRPQGASQWGRWVRQILRLRTSAINDPYVCWDAVFHNLSISASARPRDDHASDGAPRGRCVAEVRHWHEWFVLADLNGPIDFEYTASTWQTRFGRTSEEGARSWSPGVYLNEALPFWGLTYDQRDKLKLVASHLATTQPDSWPRVIRTADNGGYGSRQDDGGASEGFDCVGSVANASNGYVGAPGGYLWRRGKCGREGWAWAWGPEGGHGAAADWSGEAGQDAEEDGKSFEEEEDRPARKIRCPPAMKCQL